MEVHFDSTKETKMFKISYGYWRFTKMNEQHPNRRNLCNRVLNHDQEPKSPSESTQLS